MAIVGIHAVLLTGILLSIVCCTHTMDGGKDVWCAGYSTYDESGFPLEISSVEELRVVSASKCTHLLGSVNVHDLVADRSALGDVHLPFVSVSGYVRISGLRGYENISVLFPNLRVIYGLQLYDDELGIHADFHYEPVLIIEDTTIRNIGLSNLTVGQGNYKSPVIIKNNPLLCGIPSSCSRRTPSFAALSAQSSSDDDNGPGGMGKIALLTGNTANTTCALLTRPEFEECPFKVPNSPLQRKDVFPLGPNCPVVPILHYGGNLSVLHKYNVQKGNSCDGAYNCSSHGIDWLRQRGLPCAKVCHNIFLAHLETFCNVPKGCTRIDGLLFIGLVHEVTKVALENMTCYHSLSVKLRMKRTPSVEDLLEEYFGDVEELNGGLFISKSFQIKSLSFFKRLRSIQAMENGYNNNLGLIILYLNSHLSDLGPLENASNLIFPETSSSRDIFIELNGLLCPSSIRSLDEHENLTVHWTNRGNGVDAACNECLNLTCSTNTDTGNGESSCTAVTWSAVENTTACIANGTSGNVFLESLNVSVEDLGRMPLHYLLFAKEATNCNAQTSITSDTVCSGNQQGGWVSYTEIDRPAQLTTDLQESVDFEYLKPCQCYHLVACAYQFSPKYTAISGFRSPINTIMTPRKTTVLPHDINVTIINGAVQVSWLHHPGKHTFEVAWTRINALRELQLRASLSFQTDVCSPSFIKNSYRWNIRTSGNCFPTSIMSTYGNLTLPRGPSNAAHEIRHSIYCPSMADETQCGLPDQMTNCTIGRLDVGGYYIIEVRTFYRNILLDPTPWALYNSSGTKNESGQTYFYLGEGGSSVMEDADFHEALIGVKNKISNDLHCKKGLRRNHSMQECFYKSSLNCQELEVACNAFSRDVSGEFCYHMHVACRQQKPFDRRELRRTLERCDLEPGEYIYSERAYYIGAQKCTSQDMTPSTLRHVIQPTDSRIDIVIPLVAALALLLIVLFVVLFYQNRKRKRVVQSYQSKLALFRDSLFHTCEVYEMDEAWEIPEDSVETIRELGEGAFGKVYEGILHDRQTGSEAQVAVKTIRDYRNPVERNAFLQEASVMKKFDSPYVTHLLGIASVPEQPLVVMEYMGHGDLKRYLMDTRSEGKPNLRQQRFSAVDEEVIPTSKNPVPSAEKFLQWAHELAMGMSHLEEKRFVHRDLAARNCMLTTDLILKVGDFGLTRDIYQSDYYRKSSNGLLPLRWLPAESLRDGIYLSASDAWSYGIVLWEMATLAELPYQGLSNDEVMRFVIAGGSMDLPIIFHPYPTALMQMMKKCWQAVPENRPTFSAIALELSTASANWEPPTTTKVIKICTIETSGYSTGDLSVFSRTCTMGSVANNKASCADSGATGIETNGSEEAGDSSTDSGAYDVALPSTFDSTKMEVGEQSLGNNALRATIYTNGRVANPSTDPERPYDYPLS